jgi:hydrogenase large subunit
VCTGTHALTSVRAVEDALGITIPENANSIRNIMQLNAAGPRPPGAFLSPARAGLGEPGQRAEGRPTATSRIAADHQSRTMRNPRPAISGTSRTACAFVESGQLGPFKNGYWDNPAYKLPPEADLMAVTHYLEALDFQKEIVKIHTIFGGKNPHPNWLVGGVPCAINVDSDGAVGAINMERLNHVASIIDRAIEFIEQRLPPGRHRHRRRSISDWLLGGGCRRPGVLAYGDIPDHANDFDQPMPICCCPAGAIINGRPQQDPRGRCARPRADPGVRDHSWYEYGEAGRRQAPLGRRHRAATFELGPNTKGTRTHRRDRRGRRSTPGSRPRAGAAMRWRSARWRATSSAMPKDTSGSPTRSPAFSPIWTCRSKRCSRRWAARRHAGWRPNPGPTCSKMRYFQDKLIDQHPQWPAIPHRQYRQVGAAHLARSQARGVGTTEAPRGALGHWVVDREGSDRELPMPWCPPPGTARRGTRAGNIGAFEAALLNTPLERAGRAVGDPAHAAQLRPVPRLLHPRDVARW